jgi:hypothetical protein
VGGLLLSSCIQTDTRMPCVHASTPCAGNYTMKRRADIHQQDINCNSTDYVVRKQYPAGLPAAVSASLIANSRRTLLADSLKPDQLLQLPSC